MAFKRIEPRVLLPQPYKRLPTIDVVLWRYDENGTAPLSLSIDLGNADARLDLTEASARHLRDLLDRGLASLDTPFDQVDGEAVGADA